MMPSDTEVILEAGFSPETKVLNSSHVPIVATSLVQSRQERTREQQINGDAKRKAHTN